MLVVCLLLFTCRSDYTTGETYDGKPVYIRRFVTTSAGSKATGIGKIVAIGGSAHHQVANCWYMISYNNGSAECDLYVTDGGVLTTSTHYFNNFDFWIKYTKI